MQKLIFVHFVKDHFNSLIKFSFLVILLLIHKLIELMMIILLNSKDHNQNLLNFLYVSNLFYYNDIASILLK